MTTSVTLQTSNTLRSTSDSSSQRDAAEDTVSVASLEEDATSNVPCTFQRELHENVDRAKTLETISMSVDAFIPEIDHDEMQKHFSNLKLANSRCDGYMDAMSEGAETVLSYQNIEGRDVDLICEKYAMVLDQAIANVKKFQIRINKLKETRDAIRQERRADLSKCRDEYKKHIKVENEKRKKEDAKMVEKAEILDDEKKLKTRLVLKMTSARFSKKQK